MFQTRVLIHDFFLIVIYMYNDQSCLTLCDSMDYSPPGSSVHGIPGQKYWSGLPADLLDQGLNLRLLYLLHWQVNSLPLHHRDGNTRAPYCLLRNLYTGQEATVRTGHGTTDWFQIGKGVHQGCVLSPCLFNIYAEYIMRNA